MAASLASGRTPDDVRRELLEFLGGRLRRRGFGGAEDASLCAFVATARR